MNKSTTQLIADIRHSCSILEAINNGPTGNRQHENIEALKSDNSSLKKKITKLNRSNGQYLGMFKRKEKQVNRLLSLVDTLNQEITLLQTTMDLVMANNTALYEQAVLAHEQLVDLSNRGVISLEYLSNEPTKILITEDEGK